MNLSFLVESIQTLSLYKHTIYLKITLRIMIFFLLFSENADLHIKLSGGQKGIISLRKISTAFYYMNLFEDLTSSMLLLKMEEKSKMSI